MNNPKHTPGPWKVELSGSPNKYIAEIWNQNTKVAEINHEHLNHDVDDMANARLIAAAPEMLEALCSIYYLANLEPHLKTKYSSQTVQMIMQQMADAIAKATGGANE